jgi:plasmid stability protein
MFSITLNNLDERIKDKLLVRAKRSGHSIEEEIQLILRNVLFKEDESLSLAERIHLKFDVVGGLELPEILREDIAEKHIFTDYP